MKGIGPTETIRLRATVNRWISENFPIQRRFLSTALPTLHEDGWRIPLLARHGKDAYPLAEVAVVDETPVLVGETTETVVVKLKAYLSAGPDMPIIEHEPLTGEFYDFRHDDGIAATNELDDRSVDLLLTDPPYGISNAYICEGQVPRRLRKNGKDFIMPRGHFGHWDDAFPSPAEWTASVLPKVRGWAVIFCAQAQIGEYTEIMKANRFVAVGTIVWQKTNPVPFNHTFKPINAWEALVVGKRPGTKFNGSTVHNVFVFKSPSPKERIHPTQKPFPLISKFIDLFSDEGDLVLDSFAGSATTIIAAASKRRKVLAFENDSYIFKEASSRIVSALNLEDLV